MNKLFAMLMVLVLALCCVPAMAEDSAPEEAPEVLEYKLESVESYMQSPDHKGAYVEYTTPAFKFWVPSPMEQGGMTQEMVDADCIDFFVAADMPQYNIVVRNLDYDGLVDSIETLQEMAPTVWPDSRSATVNGVKAVVAVQNDGDAMTVILPDGNGKFVEINYNGYSDKDFVPDVGISIASIQFEG